MQRPRGPPSRDGRRARLLSVDVGSRNVAYAVLEAAGAGADGAPLPARAAAWETADISGDLIPNAVQLAGALVERHGPFDLVAIENQLGRFAARNKTVQSVLHASLLLLCPGCDVANVSPTCKTALARRVLGPERAAEIERAARDGRAAKRASCLVQKNTVVGAAERLLAPPEPGRAEPDWGLALDPRDAPALRAALAAAPKKDDLCDCLLQGLHYLERRGLAALPA